MEKVLLNINMLCFELLGCKERSSHRPRSNASVLLGKHVVRYARGRRNEENIRYAYIILHFDWITSFTISTNEIIKHENLFRLNIDITCTGIETNLLRYFYDVS